MTENVEESTKKGLVKWHSPMECNREPEIKPYQNAFAVHCSNRTRCKQRKRFRFFRKTDFQF